MSEPLKFEHTIIVPPPIGHKVVISVNYTPIQERFEDFVNDLCVAVAQETARACAEVVAHNQKHAAPKLLLRKSGLAVPGQN